MPFSVKSERADALLAELREITGEGITEAVAVAMEERLQRLRTEEKRRQIDMAWHLGQIQARYQHLAYRAGQPTDDELMYDDEGLPV